MTTHENDRGGDPLPHAGQTWRTQSGEDLLLLGRKRAGWVARGRSGVVEGLDPAGLVYVSCDHSLGCCAHHGTHTSPHMHCVLR